LYLSSPFLCSYDWGAYGFFVRKFRRVLRNFSYYIFVNSSVKGPFVPGYAKGSMHWTHPFTSKLQKDVKLVGSTISCEAGHPHVQSYAVATDQAGLALLRNSSVFSCHGTRDDAIRNAELASSIAIINAGFNIDCLMLQHSGIDWRGHAACPFGIRNPTVYADLAPFEVVFVKSKTRGGGFSAHNMQTASDWAAWVEAAGSQATATVIPS
jgi:hypothetical protein